MREKSKWQPLKVSVTAYRNVLVWKCIKTKFEWEFKHDFVKAVISRAVHLCECP